MQEVFSVCKELKIHSEILLGILTVQGPCESVDGFLQRIRAGHRPRWVGGQRGAGEVCSWLEGRWDQEMR